VSMRAYLKALYKYNLPFLSSLQVAPTTFTTFSCSSACELRPTMLTFLDSVKVNHAEYVVEGHLLETLLSRHTHTSDRLLYLDF